MYLSNMKVSEPMKRFYIDTYVFDI